jgi:hypothetical protein
MSNYMLRKLRLEYISMLNNLFEYNLNILDVSFNNFWISYSKDENKKFDQFLNECIENLKNNDIDIFCKYMIHRMYLIEPNNVITTYNKYFSNLSNYSNSNKLSTFSKKLNNEINIISKKIKINPNELNKLILFHYGYYHNILNDNIDLFGIVLWFVLLNTKYNYDIDMFVNHLIKVYENLGDGTFFELNFKSRKYLASPLTNNFDEKLILEEFNLNDLLS